MKTPTNSKASDTPLPKYLHDTDMALAVDVAVLWRALDKTTPEHASYTEDKARRGIETAGVTLNHAARASMGPARCMHGVPVQG